MIEYESITFEVLYSKSLSNFLLGTKCVSFLSHNFEYKIVFHCIEEHPFKIRKTRILEEQRKAEIKKQQNNNKKTTKLILQCLFSAITQHSVTIR